jgi:hypothetical protein
MIPKTPGRFRPIARDEEATTLVIVIPSLTVEPFHDDYF